MKLTVGAALPLAMVAIPGYIAWRIMTDVEDWFAASGAGDVLGWSLVVALMLVAAAIPVGAWGLAARAWVVRLDEGQQLASTVHTLAAPCQRVQLATADPVPALPHDAM